MRIFIILYSKNPRDDICDSSILECHSDRDTAIAELDKVARQNEGDGYTYYMEDYFVQPAKIVEGGVRNG